QHRVEHRLVGRRQIKRRPPDPGPPYLRLGGEPGARPRCVTPGDDVEQLTEILAGKVPPAEDDSAA
ncbi:MAG TPA: hypothetical protein VF729_11105, partial [Solirubrobacterales bacterium]